jgi:hypothetical protein
MVEPVNQAIFLNRDMIPVDSTGKDKSLQILSRLIKIKFKSDSGDRL